MVCLLGCCIGSFIWVQQSAITDSACVQEMANQIIDWDFNDELDGQFGLSVFGFTRITTLADPDKGYLMVVESRFFDAESMAGRFRAETGDAEETEVIEAGQREVEIKGQSVNLRFDKTRGKKSGNEYWEVVGIVPGTENSAVVMLKVLAEVYSEGDVLERFRSIR
ncbi:MAG: hypothetical protein ACR2NP_03435 [Pirellulaceae bacterium]